MKILKIFLFLNIFFVTGCTSNELNRSTQSNVVQTEEPHLYWKTIDVVVTDINKKHWFATTHWYEVNISVHSEEYNLDKTFKLKGSGAFGCPEAYNYEVGDIVKAELYSWKIDSTGEIVKREINSLK